MGNGVSDEANVKKAGLRMDEYREVALEELMPISSFRLLLATHFFEPTLKEGGEVYKLGMDHAIKIAILLDEKWILKVHNNEWMVHPRAAVEWLLSMRKNAHLVPESLKAFIEGGKNEPDVALPPVDRKPVAPERKRQAPELDRIVGEMKSLPRDKLEKMLQKEMAAAFKASRDTCQKARNLVLLMPLNVERH
jgi:hypothetical protein